MYKILLLFKSLKYNWLLKQTNNHAVHGLQLIYIITITQRPRGIKRKYIILKVLEHV